jgi:hypothetical protein
MTIGEMDMTKPGHNVVYGKNDEGKSTITSYVLRECPNQRVAIIDYHDEYTKLADEPNIDRFIPKPAEKNNEAQRMAFLRWALEEIKKRRYDIIIIDEFNQYVHNTKYESPYELIDLKNNIAHGDDWNRASAFYIMRSPAQGDSDFRETANYIICAGLQGKNAVKSLNDRVEGMGDLSKQVVGTHKFVMLGPSGYYWLNDPVPEENTTAKR